MTNGTINIEVRDGGLGTSRPRTVITTINRVPQDRAVCGVISCCDHDECGAEGVAGFYCSLKPGHEGKHSAHDNMPGSDTFGQVIETW